MLNAPLKAYGYAYLLMTLINITAAKPIAPTGTSSAEPVLVQIVDGKTKPFVLSGSHLTWVPVNDVDKTTQAPATTFKAAPLGLIAAEKTDTVDKTEGSILVQYYQEKNSKAPFASYTSLTPALPAATKTPVVASNLPKDPVAVKWVDLHNRARAPFGAGKLEWRADLVARAKANAELCTGDHSNSGENIAAQSGALTPDLTVKWWMAEEAFYDWNDPVFQDKTGHFTQAVWKDSQYVGCYTTQCAPGTVFNETFGISYQATCEYDPVGNYINEGQFAKNVGKRTSGSIPWLP